VKEIKPGSAGQSVATEWQINSREHPLVPPDIMGPQQMYISSLCLGDKFVPHFKNTISQSAWK
jgi:hypothetical protein